MASRRFFAYEPYDYYYAAPHHYYPYPYYHQHQQQPSAPARRTSGFFPVAADAEPAAARRAAVDPAPRARSVSIPVHFVGSDSEPEREMKAAGLRAEPRVGRKAAAPAVVPVKRAPSAEAAAVRVQAAARGFMARKSVRAVREVEREAEEVREKIAREAEALRGDARARIAVGEALMRLLLRLDAVRGARDYRRRVTKRVLALQDAVDALEAKLAPAPEPEPEALAENGSEVTAEMADESAVVSELQDPVEHSGVIEEEAVAETTAEMEVDGGRADGLPDEAEETEQAQDVGNFLGGGRPEGAEAEGEWEMVTEEPEPRRQEPAGTEIRRTAEAGDGDLDTRKVMEMVAALCERSAQQCAVISALAARVDALERAVRRAEDAERRRRRGKKLKKEGKGSNHSKCYSD